GKVTKEIYEEEKDFDKILDIQGRSRNYFTKKNPENMRDPQQIKDTPYYYEANLSANQIMKIVSRILEKFDYDESEFKLVLKSDQV
ncbi:MAG: hypothetical protein ACOCTT_04245, partial [archaeon]